MTTDTTRRAVRVLIVEDSEEILMVEKILFSKEGADVVGFVDVVPAMDAIRASLKSEQYFDIIVLDIRLPQLNGFEFAQQIRRWGYKGLLIAVTASVTVDGESESAKAGIDRYVSKSVLNRELVRELFGQVSGK